MDWVPPTREYFAIEMEYFPSSTLAELLDSSAGGFVKSYAKLLGLFEQVLVGVAYLHGIEMCHGDIKPHNILVSGDTAKITDFGSSVWPEDMYARTRENGGTILYSAPELASTLLRGRSMQDLFLGDICSLGVLLYHIVTGDLALMLSVSLSSKFSVIPYYLLIRKSPSQAAVIRSLSRIPKS